MTGLRWAAAAASLMLIAACQLPMLQQLNNKFDPASASYVPPAANIPTGFTVVSGSVTASVSFSGALGAASYNLYTSTTPLTSFTTGTKTAGVTSPASLTPAAAGTANYAVITAIVKGVESPIAGTLSITLGSTPGSASATILPGTSLTGTVSWASSNPSTATVSTAGLVTGVATGTTTITGTAGGQKVAQATVNVGAPPQMPFVYYEGPFSLTAKGSGWYSANVGIAIDGVTVNPGDTVTLVIAGTASVNMSSLTTGLNNGTSDITTFIPIAASVVSGVPFELTSTATVTTQGISTNQGITFNVWASSNTIQSTAAPMNFTKFEFFKNLGAYIPSTSITVSPKTMTLVAGQATGTLAVSASPASATVQGAIWSSSNTSIATVDANGVVSPWSEGTATITGTSPDGGWTDTSVITVTAPAGSSWTSATLPAAADWSHVAFGNGIFVALPDTGTSAAVSSDGTNWTATSLPVGGPWTNIAFGNGTFVVSHRTGTVALSSTDGRTWTQRVLTNSHPWQSIDFGSGKFLLVSTDASNVSNYSSDGITWHEGPLPQQQANWYVRFVGGQFYLFASSFPWGAISANGLSWTNTNNNYPIVNDTQLAYGNGAYLLLVSGTTNTIYRASDGMTWASRTLPITANWSDLTFGSGAFVAIASGGSQIVNSADGLTWTTRTLPSAHSWSSVTFGNGKFVAVANDSTTAAVTSP